MLLCSCLEHLAATARLPRFASKLNHRRTCIVPSVEPASCRLWWSCLWEQKAGPSRVRTRGTPALLGRVPKLEIGESGCYVSGYEMVSATSVRARSGNIRRCPKPGSGSDPAKNKRPRHAGQSAMDRHRGGFTSGPDDHDHSDGKTPIHGRQLPRACSRRFRGASPTKTAIPVTWSTSSSSAQKNR
jgi:hypothetical protein